MKITLLGVLGLVALGALLLYVAKQILEDLEKDTLSGCPTPDLNSFDALEPDLYEGEIGLPGILDSQ
jgi:hypothetical protein